MILFVPKALCTLVIFVFGKQNTFSLCLEWGEGEEGCKFGIGYIFSDLRRSRNGRISSSVLRAVMLGQVKNETVLSVVTLHCLFGQAEVFVAEVVLI